MTTASRRILAGLAAGTLAFGLAACSGDGNRDNGPTEADVASSASSATAEASSAASSAAESSSEAASESAKDSEKGEKEVTTAGGQTETVPAALAQSIEQHKSDFGEVSAIEKSDDGVLATFANGDHVVYSEETGPVELVGKIGETWVSEGGLKSEVGLPKAPETSATDATGWIQEFQNGSISWTNDGSGFSADVES